MPGQTLYRVQNTARRSVVVPVFGRSSRRVLRTGEVADLPLRTRVSGEVRRLEKMRMLTVADVPTGPATAGSQLAFDDPANSGHLPGF